MKDRNQNLDLIQDKSKLIYYIEKDKIRVGEIYEFDDVNARLIHVLGNPKEIEYENGNRNSKMMKNEIFVIRPNGTDNPNEFQRYKIVEISYSFTGFTGAIVQQIDKNGHVVETILWADGSKGINNLFDLSQLYKLPINLYQMIADWLINDLIYMGRGKLPPQFGSLYRFAQKYKDNGGTISKMIGQSLVGIIMSALSYVQGFNTEKAYVYSGVLNEDLWNDIDGYKVFNWGLKRGNNETQNKDGLFFRKLERHNYIDSQIPGMTNPNLQSFKSPGEPLTGQMEIDELITQYAKKEIQLNPSKPHSATAYFNTNGQKGVYLRIIEEATKADPKIIIKPMEDAIGVNVVLEGLFVDNDSTVKDKHRRTVIKLEPKKKKNSDIGNSVSRHNSLNKPMENERNEFPENLKDKDIIQNTKSGTPTGGAAGIEENKIPDDIIKQKSQKYSDPMFMESYFSEVGEYGTLREKFKNGGSFHYDRNEKLEENLPPAERELSRLKRNVDKINETLAEMKEQLEYHEKVVNVYNCPELAEFYLHRPVRNIIADFLEDYCIMEGIDYED